MHLLVIGVGYVGLVTGTCFSEMGYHVTCLDINPARISSLQEGCIPIYEPGLEEMVKRNIKANRLAFTTDYSTSVPQADICFIAVDTPPGVNGAANLSQVETAARTLGRFLIRSSVIVMKSTVPVGTTAYVGTLIEDILRERGTSIDFDMVFNPEFLKEGNAVHDFMKPNRIVIGVTNDRSAALMKELYSPFMLNHERLLVMDLASAELAKYAANAMLATRISFMNEMALLCEKVGANVNWVRKAIGADERIGHQFLYPGVGFGGSCFPKDLKALIHQAEREDLELSILKAVHQVNQKQKRLMGARLENYFEEKGGIKGKTIGILGLSFKPDTDDIREAPALILIEEMLSQAVYLRLFDPIAMPNAQALLGTSPLIRWCQNELEVAEGADALVLMTEWKQFRLLNVQALLTRMRGQAFFDGRNQYQPEEMARKGFDYFSIGREPAYALEESRLEDSQELVKI